MNTDIHIKDMYQQEQYFKVNLPNNLFSYNTGNGEGIWVEATSQEEYQKYLSRETKQFIKVKLLNNSVYYPSLVMNTIIEVELRGDDRPVLRLKELIKLLRNSNS